MPKQKISRYYELEDYTDGEILLLRFECKEAADLLISKWDALGVMARFHLGRIQRIGGRNNPRTGTYKRTKLDKMHVITLTEVQAVASRDLLSFEVRHGLYEEELALEEIESIVSGNKIDNKMIAA